MKTPAFLTLMAILLIACDPRKDDLATPCSQTTCLNGGTVNTSNCTCSCPSGYTGGDCGTPSTNGGGGGTGGGGGGTGGGPTSCSVSYLNTGWSSAPGGPFQNEAQVILPTGYLMTGIGMRVNGDKVKTLMVKGRELRSNCTLGPQNEYRAGQEPNGSLEMQYTVPTGAVITGIQLGFQSDDLKRLVVKYRFVQNQPNGTLRLGDEYTHNMGSSQIEGGLLVTNFSSFDPQRTAFSGFGAVCYNSNVYQIWGEFRKINP